MNELFTPQLGPLLWHALRTGLLGILIYAVFRLIWRNAIPIIRRPRLKSWLTQWLPMLEILTWVTFILLSMGYLIAANFVPGLIFSLILIGGFWPYLLNLMGGMVIRMSNRFRIGQRVQFNQQRGTITKMGLLEMDLEIEGGQTIVVPYNQFPTSSIMLEDPEEEIVSHPIELYVNPSWSLGEVETHILSKVLILPWASVGRLPSIEPIIQEPDQALYRVVLFSSHKKYFPQMEKILQNHFNPTPSERPTTQTAAQ